MNAPTTTQFATILYFNDLKDGEQLRTFERMRKTFKQTWGHLLAEHGMWWGQELGTRERLWWIVFFKNKDASDAAHTDPGYIEFERDFSRFVGPAKMKMTNTSLCGSIPLHEALGAPAVLLNYIRCAGHHAAKCNMLSRRLSELLGYPGFQGLAYVPAVESNYETVIIGAWDSVEASQQIGTDGRIPELLSELEEIYDGAKQAFFVQVKFEKHS